MPVPWGVLSFLFRVVGPNIPDIVSTINTLRTGQEEKPNETENLQARLADIDRTLAVQLELIEQLTKQLRELESALKKTMALALLALAIAVLTLGMWFLQSQG